MSRLLSHILVQDARQNNLRGITVRIPHGALTVVTGVSGSGKSSLAFGTLYAEGQRRYVESFSTYARQFLERMDRPRVRRITGLPPAVAVAQAGALRSSRSTVATMTEILDHLKVLWARAATLRCGGCGREVRREDPGTILDSLPRNGPLLVGYAAAPRPGESGGALRERLRAAGVVRLRVGGDVGPLDQVPEAALAAGEARVVLDRVEPARTPRLRLLDSIEQALRLGEGAAEAFEVGTGRARRFATGLRCATCDRGYADPSPGLFSWNHPSGACPECRGFGRVIGVDPEKVVPDPRRTISEGALKPFEGAAAEWEREELMRFCRRRRIPTGVPWRALPAETRRLLMEGEGEAWFGVRGFFRYLEGKSYKMHVRVFLSRFRRYESCPACGGGRLRPEALLWRLGGRTLPETCALPVSAALPALREAAPGAPGLDTVRAEVLSRLETLERVGLGYLTLDRQTRTLSGGEVQRVHLSAALGARLVGTLFVLDEPTVGLHARDVARLVGVLHELRDRGNTLVVVEHDPAVIREADGVVQLGPGPGERGGRLVFQGRPSRLPRIRRVAASPSPRVEPTCWLRVRGATLHNLRGLDAEIPLGTLCVLAGVSGSGKSTLAVDVLHAALTGAAKAGGKDAPLRALEGAEPVAGAVLVDQAPLARTPRGNAATYTGVLGSLRGLFAAEPEARRRGYGPGTFSFNVPGGRCERCRGDGRERVEMQFLADVDVECPGCRGRRFREEVLGVRCRGLSIADALDLTAAEAAARFGDVAPVARGLAPLVDVGLGYLCLGQPLSTLSGGEAQRLKLARQLALSGVEGLLFILDEPTTGLHPSDVQILLVALRRLVGRGHSVLVIEHHLDAIRAADWVVEMGPEGGEEGGRIVAAGPPEA
ncbi:MAG: excinuclease ABC subunit UvrA, partial [Planctomycetales bacterium]|nr:excinuclease ABC subunit UvrA [Planctomycetales bacterium]